MSEGLPCCKTFTITIGNPTGDITFTWSFSGYGNFTGSGSDGSASITADSTTSDPNYPGNDVNAQCTALCALAIVTPGTYRVTLNSTHAWISNGNGGTTSSGSVQENSHYYENWNRAGNASPFFGSEGGIDTIDIVSAGCETVNISIIVGSDAHLFDAGTSTSNVSVSVSIVKL